MSMSYPSQIEIVPLAKPPSCDVTVPGSKSITNRALVLAALGSQERTYRLTGALKSEDTEVMADCLGRLGLNVIPEWPQILVCRHYYPNFFPATEGELFVANSGTSMRFLAAVCAVGSGSYVLDGIPRMRERPIEDLLSALRDLGADAESIQSNGCPPVRINAKGLGGGHVRIRANLSSQFLSALLMVAPYARESVTIKIEGTAVSEPYIEMTVQMMRAFGLTVETSAPGIFRITPHEVPPETAAIFNYAIEPDASAASYFWAAAAIAGGRVTVRGLTRKSLQGDVAFVDALAQMGCRVEECDTGITVHGKPLHGIDVDMNAISDTVMSLGAVALFAEGPTTIRNVAHIRHKETDRIAALAVELRKFGAEVDEFPDGLRIHPRPLTGAAVDTYNDHRMAMSLALVGLRVPGVTVNNPGCVAKTYPEFWQDFEKLRS
jgi:3-phosphoshikimate 1-carboxyvinyltransferase